MLSSDWLIKGVFFFLPILSFSALSPSQGYLSLGIPYTTLLGKYHARGKIPSLNSLWHHGCNSELLVFLLSTNAKVKKNDRRQCQPLFLKSLKCIYFKFICIIFFNMLYIVAKQWFYSIFDFVADIHIFEKIFPGLKFWTCLHATVLLAVKYSAELNKYILLMRVIFAKNTGFEDSQISFDTKAAREICLFSQPVFFANNPN